MFETMEVRMMNIRFRKGRETSFGEAWIAYVSFFSLFLQMQFRVKEILRGEKRSERARERVESAGKNWKERK